MVKMVENTTSYKNMILRMMDTINILSNENKHNEFSNPIKYHSTFQHMVLNSTSCLDRDEYRMQPAYLLLRKYISALSLSNKYPSDDKDITTIQFYADLKYSDEEHVLDRVSYGINISIVKDSVVITPYLDLVYMNLRSRLALVATNIYSDDNYTFYKLYDLMYAYIETFMVDNQDILDTIKEVDGSSTTYVIEEMAMLTTLVYMKHIVTINEYEEFMELEGKNTNICSTSIDTTKAMYEMNKSLFEIGTRDPKLLDDTISKIRDIINKVAK